MLRSKSLCGFALLLSILSVCAALPVSAQNTAAVTDRLSERYDVLVLSDGWLLQPLADRDDFRAIEVRDGRVAVDGTWVDENQLRRFIDADAALVFELADGRSRVVEAPPSAPPGPPAAPPSPTAPSPTAPADGTTSAERRTGRSAEQLERVREQIEQALERAQRGDLDREVLERLREVQDLDDLPRDLDRLTRELERAIDRNQRRTTRRGRDSQVTLGSDLTVDRGERVSEVVVIGGNLDVRGEISGDSTVVLGDAVVSGFIDGSLVVVGGNIHVESGGGIDGDAIAVGGAVRTAPGGHIDGEIIHLDFGQLWRMGDVRVGKLYWPHVQWFDFGVFDTLGRIFRIFFLAVLALLVYALAGAKVEQVGSWVRGAPWRSLFSGLALEIAFFPAMVVLIVVLCLSIVGILLVCLVPPLAILLLMVVFLLGYASVALSLGDWLGERFGVQTGNRYAMILLGMAAIEVWSVLGDIVGMIPFFGWIGALILIAAWCLKFAVWTTGLGAAVLCQFSHQAPPMAPASGWAHAPRPQAPPPPPAAGEDAWDRYEADDLERRYPLLQGDDLPDAQPDAEPAPGEYDGEVEDDASAGDPRRDP